MSSLDLTLVKKPYQKEKYTDDQIKEMAAAFIDPVYFAENFCYVQEPLKGRLPFHLFDYQKRLIKIYQNYKNSINMLPRQCGKTTCAAAYILWYAMFKPDSTILVAANKRDGALEIMLRVRFMYENLIDYIRCGVITYNKYTIEFDNGSRIISQATTETTGRGLSASLVYCDELSHIRNNIVEAFWASIAPTLSTGGKIIITSTPDQEHHLFGQLVKGAQNTLDDYGNDMDIGKNGFKFFTALWNEHPDRDEEWAAEQLAKIGEEKWRREFLCIAGNSNLSLLNQNGHTVDMSIEKLYENLAN